MNLSALSPGVFARSETYIDNIENVDVLDEWPPIEGSSLDSSQMQAVERILTRKIAIIQGPPGTGTFLRCYALVET